MLYRDVPCQNDARDYDKKLTEQESRTVAWRTDRQTDGQTTCNLNTTLCTIVHRAVKIEQEAQLKNHVKRVIHRRI